MPSLKPSEAKLRLIVESYQRLTGLPLISHADLNPTQPPPIRQAHDSLVRGGAGSALPLTRGSWRGLGFTEQSMFNEDELREALWKTPRAILAHGTEDDPIFFYGNRLALQLFEMTFDEFTRLPSRLSAEPMAQQARIELLEKVSRQGFVEGYSGIRIAKSGKSFRIADTTVWNLMDENGVIHGQAAVFVKQQV